MAPLPASGRRSTRDASRRRETTFGHGLAAKLGRHNVAPVMDHGHRGPVDPIQFFRCIHLPSKRPSEEKLLFHGQAVNFGSCFVLFFSVSLCSSVFHSCVVIHRRNNDGTVGYNLKSARGAERFKIGKDHILIWHEQSINLVKG